jgi:hypothetical protein
MRVFPILATILTVGTARVATPAEAAEIRLTDPNVRAALERAVARVRTEYGGKTPVPGGPGRGVGRQGRRVGASAWPI